MRIKIQLAYKDPYKIMQGASDHLRCNAADHILTVVVDGNRYRSAVTTAVRIAGGNDNVVSFIAEAIGGDK